MDDQRLYDRTKSDSRIGFNTRFTQPSTHSFAPSGRRRVGGHLTQGGAALCPGLSCGCPIRGEMQKPNRIYLRARRTSVRSRTGKRSVAQRANGFDSPTGLHNLAQGIAHRLPGLAFLWNCLRFIREGEAPAEPLRCKLGSHWRAHFNPR